MDTNSHLCPFCGRNTTNRETFVEHFKDHKPDKLILSYPVPPGTKARLARYTVEMPPDLPLKVKSMLLLRIDKAVEAAMTEVTVDDVTPAKAPHQALPLQPVTPSQG